MPRVERRLICVLSLRRERKNDAIIADLHQLPNGISLCTLQPKLNPPAYPVMGYYCHVTSSLQNLSFNRIGRPTDHDNLYYREFKPLLKNAGLGDQGFTFHSLRHTFATALFERRQHPKIVQSLLGHASITQTMDTYSHLLEDIGGDAVDGLDEAFR